MPSEQCLLPAAIRSTRVSSDEVSPAAAAIAGTPATAGCGRIHTLSMEIPLDPFPDELKRETGIRFLCLGGGGIVATVDGT